MILLKNSILSSAKALQTEDQANCFLTTTNIIDIQL